MILHEPCRTRGDCYHALGAHNIPREAKARGGRNQSRETKILCARKTNAIWGKTPEAYEARVRSGRNGGRIGGLIAGRIAIESGQLASLGQGRKNVESGQIQTLGRKYGRIAVESGQLISTAAKGGRIQGLKNVESGHIQALGRIYGRTAVENGQLARISKGVPSTADGILFRSQTEAMFYCVAQELGGEPVYEPRATDLPDGRSYTPDFVLGRSILGIPANVPIELKPARNVNQKTLSKAIEAGAFVVYWDELVE